MKKILDHLKRRWIRYGFETVVVVNGVLIAFTLNSWNQHRLNGLEEKKIMHNLKTEFEGNIEELSAIMELESKMIAATTEILEAIDNNDHDDTPLLDSLLSFTLHNPSFDPKSGSIDNLISSGELELITNDSLRNLLIAWPGFVADMKEEEEFLRMLQLNESLLNDYIIVRNIGGYMTGNFRYSVQFNRSNQSSDYESLFQDRRFDNLLSRRMITLQVALKEGEVVRATASKILEILETELAE